MSRERREIGAVQDQRSFVLPVFGCTDAEELIITAAEVRDPVGGSVTVRAVQGILPVARGEEPGATSRHVMTLLI
ncbi:hypothetical protein AB0393_38715 [Streptomyces cyaneofuscatus]|uniref:hypothetical protein n=1 Tax=Streptomyces cyaneofuscatus TaxID=66883 RepID=UPI0034502F39